ncbi:MAG: hypothetical protein JNM84_07040, partial [Planctomycetes bacterium]|nr:hypothetical protein [Planctomycetota bacterium]
LREHPLVEQLYKHEDSLVDRASEWSSERWAKHVEEVRNFEFLRTQVANELLVLNPNDESLASAGLVEVAYPGLDEFTMGPQTRALLPEPARERAQREFHGFAACILDHLRTQRHITTAPEIDDRDLDLGDAPVGLPVGREAFAGKSDRHMRRKFTAAWLGVLGAASDSRAALDLAHRFLEALYDEWMDLARLERYPWLRARQIHREDTQGLLLLWSGLGLRLARERYRCRQTMRVFVRSIANSAPFSGSIGTLEGPLPSDVGGSPRFERLQRELAEEGEGAVFRMGLWAEEHSAQLDADENRRIQELFKFGARNVLSSSTTMELGIDIGGLSAVFCTNFPPNKAAYLQRAGRAGRRADGSAVVLSYARSRPWDNMAFADFGEFLSRELRKPVTSIGRRRIALKHLNAWLLGEFFRRCSVQAERTGTMNAYGRIDEFLGLRLPVGTERGVEIDLDSFQKGKELPEHLEVQPWWGRHAGWFHAPMQAVPNFPATRAREYALRPHGVADGFLGFLGFLSEELGAEDHKDLKRLFGDALGARDRSDVAALISGAADSFRATLAPWLREWAGLLAAWFGIDPERRDAAYAIRNQMITRGSSTTIEVLADGGFLPRYGFPIGLMRLQVLRLDGDRRGSERRGLEEERISLERGGLLAIAEYVPGSKLVAGGRLIQSRGLLRAWTGLGEETFGERWFLRRCPEGHVVPDQRGEQAMPRCPICEKEFSPGEPMQALVPRAGFTTAAWDRPSSASLRIERIGRSERQALRIDQAEPRHVVEDFGAVRGLRARFFEGAQLFVFNPGQFSELGDGGRREPTEGMGFAICTKCGFADVEKFRGEGRQRLPRGFALH